MTRYIKENDGKASQMMWDSGLGGAGPWVNCSCGLDHSVPVDDDVNEPNVMFEYIELDSQLFVYGCKGCEEKLLKYENFIWVNRNLIRHYLKLRIDQEKAWADQEHVLNILSGVSL